MAKRERIEPLPEPSTVETIHENEDPCEDCAERYRTLMMFTAAFAFISAVLLCVIGLAVWGEIQ